MLKTHKEKYYTFQLKRYKCPVCGSVELELPDCIQPKKHYFKLTIDAVKTNKIDYCIADERTMQRWKK